MPKENWHITEITTVWVLLITWKLKVTAQPSCNCWILFCLADILWLFGPVTTPRPPLKLKILAGNSHWSVKAPKNGVQNRCRSSIRGDRQVQIQSMDTPTGSVPKSSWGRGGIYSIMQADLCIIVRYIYWKAELHFTYKHLVRFAEISFTFFNIPTSFKRDTSSGEDDQNNEGLSTIGQIHLLHRLLVSDYWCRRSRCNSLESSSKRCSQCLRPISIK